MFENIIKLFKRPTKPETLNPSSKESAKERLHIVLMQDRVNVSADFLDLMTEEIIEVIKKYIDIDESAMDVRLTNQENEDGTQGAPTLYANIPIINIKKINNENDQKIDSVSEIEQQNNKELNQKTELENIKQDEKVIEKGQQEAEKKENQKIESQEQIKESNNNKEEKNELDKSQDKKND